MREKQTENVLEKVVMVLISFQVSFLFCFYTNEWYLIEDSQILTCFKLYFTG